MNVRNLDGPDFDVHIEYLGKETGGMRIISFSEDQNWPTPHRPAMLLTV